MTVPRNITMIKRIESAPVTYPFKFTFLGDSGATPNPVGDLIFSEMAGQIDATDSAFFINLGDFAGPGTRDRHEKYLQIVDRIRAPNLCVMGNHDQDDEGGWERFSKLYGPVNYHFALGNTLFIVINCQWHTEGPREEDLAYLEKCLTEEKKAVSIVMMHMPPNLDDHFAPHAEWGFSHYENQFLQIAREHNVSLVCCAHALCYDYLEHQGIPFVTSGGGGWGLCSHLGPDCTASDPPHRGVFYHFVEITVQESGAISGRVVRACEGTRSDPAYDWSAQVNYPRG